ncbi:polypeptide N-acetylgalactosaminyltransferase 13-like [Babylonia areolata]|uniref:polypeptide N-acetylgalactosaminyltransferase 13-like n=1 Tax=Babylonia areolata TaxID=304850 RepID=UPI003FD13936
MKTLNRYLLVAAAVVSFLVALKVLIFLPPADNDRFSERHSKDGGSLLWRRGSDGHDELQSFGRNNPRLTGEMGRGVVLPPGEKGRGEEAMKKFNLNVVASDLISLNRQIPDSRPVGCESVQYPDNLPGTAVVIPFHNEWPSVLLRTVYSIINRTPKHLLQQIILVDDASDLKSLKDDLDHFIREHFPSNLVKLVRLPDRVGLIRARLEGFKHVTAQVVSFFDSHMEVNVDWLQPLLVEIKKNRQTIAMGHLDYILPDTFEYSFTPGYRTRYGFDWRLIFFETYFLKSQEKDKDVTDPLPGVVMVGPGFAINSDYFREMGTYDEGMKIWGGENLELAWRIWMCGGRLVHMACSKLGHIARPQPYTFPEGRYETEIHNYKRAVEVWMGPYKKLVYEHHPKMKDLDVGDLTERKALRDRLQCKDFTWYLKNIWPELYPYGDNATHWGAVKNHKDNLCLDNNDYLFLGPEVLTVKDCSYQPHRQSFGLTLDHKLRSVLQCVGVQEEGEDMVPVLVTCHDEPYHTWTHTNDKDPFKWTYTSGFQLKHDQTGLCMQLMQGPRLVMQSCRTREEGQVWKFERQGPPSSLANEGRATPSPPGPGPKQEAGRNAQPEALSVKSAKEMLNEFEKQVKGMAAGGGVAVVGRNQQNPVMHGGQMMQGAPGMQRGRPMPGNGPLVQGAAGPMMQGAGPMMQGGPVVQGGPMMQGGPVMQGAGPMMQGGGPMMQGGGPVMQGAGPMVQRGGPIMQGGGGSLMQGRGSLNKGGPLMDSVQMGGVGGGGMMANNMPRAMMAGAGGRGGVGGGGRVGAMSQFNGGNLPPVPKKSGGKRVGVDMQEAINRQLYAEAKRSGRVR